MRAELEIHMYKFNLTYSGAQIVPISYSRLSLLS